MNLDVTDNLFTVKIEFTVLELGPKLFSTQLLPDAFCPVEILFSQHFQAKTLQSLAGSSIASEYLINLKYLIDTTKVVFIVESKMSSRGFF